METLAISITARSRFVVLLLVLCLGAGGNSVGKPPAAAKPIMLVVMDPLAKELACACVKGYGQRDYRKLAGRLEAVLKQPLAIEFSDDLVESLTGLSAEQEVMIIGEHSVVRQGAKRAGLKCHPICELTDVDGGTMLTGSFITRSDDSAKVLKDVAGRKVLSGWATSDDHQTAALAALRVAGVEPASPLEKRGSYSEAALDVLDSRSAPPLVAVIPSYALPLLVGCGSIKPGELKVIGKTQPLPFITVFLTDQTRADKQQRILKTLLNVKADATLVKAMESRDGFRLVEPQKPSGAQTNAGLDWPDWRGLARDGRVGTLPRRLPATAKVIWRKAAMAGGLAGLSVGDERLILAERDFGEEHDVYRCLNASTGELLWRVEFPTRGQLDYGQAPRAAPVIHAGRAYLLGAFGDLRCVNVTNGKVVWRRQLPREFQAALPTWGMCSTPLLIDDLLIVNPGGTNASLAALDSVTGRTRWVTPGWPAAYAAFICAQFGGRRQIVGYDRHSLGGWDAKTGERLWQLVPPTEGDFNVPTPISVDGGVLVSTENNGTRLYRFDESGRIIPKPAGEFAGLAPATTTPVVTCGRVFGTHHGLHCLEVANGLKPVWHRDDDALGDHATLLADEERVLVITLNGELILLDAKMPDCTIISRLRLFEDDVEVYSHPALVGTRLYVRGGSSVLCIDLAMAGD